MIIKIVIISFCCILFLGLIVAFLVTKAKDKNNPANKHEKVDITQDKAYKHLIKELKGRNDIH